MITMKGIGCKATSGNGGRVSFQWAAVGNHDNRLHSDSLPEQSWLTFFGIFPDRILLAPLVFGNCGPSGG